MKRDKFARARRASGHCPDEFGNGDDSGSDSESNPFAPFFGFQNKRENPDNKQNDQTMKVN